MMTNQELSEAIAYAFERSGTETFGGYARGSEASKEMLAHLKELLAIQRTRAAFVQTETPNAPLEGRD